MTEKKKPPAPEPIAGLSFEQALRELEGIVARLEGGQVDLEESISIYERGSRLRAHCDAILKDAQAKVEKIVVASDGTVSAAPEDGAGQTVS
ncbi:MAG: exodeoxyribonuclease VII small subunit [Alphaproteobacteria bacterium]|nr:exodeoxyribonuclease VII small subunit [Alphaproteobacteria bacterium]